MFDADARKIEAIRLPLWGKVVEDEGVVSWVLLDGLGEPVVPVQTFLRDFTARGNSDGSVRSYAMDLLRWWRFLIAIGVPWDQAAPAEVRDFVLWFKQATKPVAAVRKQSAKTAGTVNRVTRKTYLDDALRAAKATPSRNPLEPLTAEEVVDKKLLSREVSTGLASSYPREQPGREMVEPRRRVPKTSGIERHLGDAFGNNPGDVPLFPGVAVRLEPDVGDVVVFGVGLG